MSSRAVTRLAWSLCAISVVLMALALVLRYLVRSEPLPAGFGGWPEAALGIVADLAIPVLGAIIASRRPGNPIGWLFCAAGVAVAVDSAAEGYAIYALLAGSDSSAGGVAAAWVTNWSSFFAFGLLPFVLLLFPTGKLPSRRWRPLAFLAAFLYVALPAGYALLPGPLGRFPFLENPLGYGGDAGEILPGVNQALAWMAFLMVTLAATISLVLRFRRSRGVERQQIKWFAYAAMLVAAYLIADLFFQDALTPVAPFLDPIIFGSLFAAIAIAILRHRLFDIDVVINRTLVYGMLTASLALVYFSIVVLLQALLRAATGSESQLAVVASTLTIAALFQPLRRRIQGFIDHRFYRKKYDAAKTLEAFSARLREETDLDQLNAELVAVVRNTMQPEHVGLWLREPGSRQ